MTFLPYEKTTIETPLKTDTVVSRLLNATEYDRSTLGFMRYPASNKHFFGEVSPSSFYLERIIREGRNDFQPVMFGQITHSNRGAMIYVTLRLNWKPLFVFAVGFIFSAVITLLSTLDCIIRPDGGFDFLKFVGFTLLWYLVVIIPYNNGAKKSKILLQKTLGIQNTE